MGIVTGIFSKGDTVSKTETVITKKQGRVVGFCAFTCCPKVKWENGTTTEEFQTSLLTLVKKAAPPAPKAGTVFRATSPVTYTTWTYVAGRDGKLTFIDRDGGARTTGTEWTDLNHDRVTVLYTP